MKKIITVIITGILLQQCAYNPKIDTAGRSGTYNTDQARLITDDVQHCKKIADEITNRAWDEWKQISNLYATTITLGIIPLREKTYNRRVKQCLTGRGHSVLD